MIFKIIARADEPECHEQVSQALRLLRNCSETD